MLHTHQTRWMQSPLWLRIVLQGFSISAIASILVLSYLGFSINSAQAQTRQGRWSAPRSWPLIAVQSALLSNGKVLTWSAIDDDLNHGWYSGGTNHSTRVDLWDPIANTHQFVNEQDNGDMFCSGFASLPDGRFLVGGGSVGRGIAIRNTNIFNPSTSTWSVGNLLNQARWYGSITPLANGEMMMIGGRPSTPEIFGLNGVWRFLTNVTGTGEYYPWTQQAPNGEVFYAGPYSTMKYVSTSGDGAIRSAGERDGVRRDYGSYATYDVGKVLASGGSTSLKTAIVIDYSAGPPTLQISGSMAYGRRQHNLTILANGEVLATGGNSNGIRDVDPATGVYAAEIWNPITRQWRTDASMSITRQYHSTALLLPDGRVLSAGGGLCCLGNYDNINAEIYSPPYLFNFDGTRMARPVIRGAPAQVNYGQSFAITSNQAASIQQVHLIRLGAVTHSVNQEQRLVPLSFTVSSRTLNLIAPGNANIAPPGYYMLFIVDNNGIPSVAKFLRVGNVAVSARPANIRSQVQHILNGKSVQTDGQPTESGAAMKVQQTQSGSSFVVMASPIFKTGVRLNWSIFGEKNLSGFQVYRSTDDALEHAQKLTHQRIGNTRYDRTFGFDDRTAHLGRTYAYWVTALYKNGKTATVGPLKPKTLGTTEKGDYHSGGHSHP